MYNYVSIKGNIWRHLKEPYPLVWSCIFVICSLIHNFHNILIYIYRNEYFIIDTDLRPGYVKFPNEKSGENGRRIAYGSRAISCGRIQRDHSTEKVRHLGGLTDDGKDHTLYRDMRY